MANKDRMIKKGGVIVEDERKPRMGTGAPVVGRVTFDRITGLRPLSIPTVSLVTGGARIKPTLTRAKLLMPQQVGEMTGREIKQRSVNGLVAMPKTPRQRPGGRKFPDQEPLERRPVAAAKEGYVSLRMVARDGVIKVVGVKHVDSELVQTRKVRSGLVYEVLHRGKRVAMGHIPDAGQKRSFPHPDPAPGQEGHAISELPEVRFTARIPAKEFSAAKVPQLDVSLMRVKKLVRRDVLDDVPLRKQLPNELRDVATLRERIRAEVLPRPVAEQLRAVLKRR